MNSRNESTLYILDDGVNSNSGWIFYFAMIGICVGCIMGLAVFYGV